MLTVACLLKSEPISPYGIEDVLRLAAGVRRNLTEPHRFVCLTDRMGIIGDGIETIPLTLGLRGWWAKMELFSLSGPLLYFDLDTVIVGNIDALDVALHGLQDMLVVRDFYSQLPSSGILGWPRGYNAHAVIERFGADSIGPRYSEANNAIYLRTKSGNYRGDQDWLRAHIFNNGSKPVFAQDVQPGIVSYKVDVRQNRGQQLPVSASVVCFHGQPRPRDVLPQPDWLCENWGPPI